MTRGIHTKLHDPALIPPRGVDLTRALARCEARLGRRPDLRVGVATDHLGATLGRHLARYLVEIGLEIRSHIPSRALVEEAGGVDYAAWASPVLTGLQRGELEHAVLICGDGRGMLKLARAWPGARPHLAELLAEVEASRRYSDSNVLCLGARSLGRRYQLMRLLVTAWLGEPHQPAPRHERADALIDAAVQQAKRPTNSARRRARVPDGETTMSAALATLARRHGVKLLLRAPGDRLDPELLCDSVTLRSRGFRPLAIDEARLVEATRPRTSSSQTAVLVRPSTAEIDGAPTLGRPPWRSQRLPPRWLLLACPRGRSGQLRAKLAHTHQLHAMQHLGRVELLLFDRVPAYPRTPYLAGSAVGTREDQVLSKAESARLLTRPLTLLEKIDGFNVGIWFSRDQLCMCHMDGAMLGDEHPALVELKLWAERRRPGLWRALGERMVLYVEAARLRHSVRYDRLDDLALGFDLLDRARGRFLSTTRARTVAQQAGVRWVPVLAAGAELDLEGLRRMLARSRLGPELMEGIVLRHEVGDWTRTRAKLVRAGFELAEHPVPWAQEQRNTLLAESRPRPAPGARRGRRRPPAGWLRAWLQHLEACGFPRQARALLAQTEWRSSVERPAGRLYLGRRGEVLVGLRLRHEGAGSLRHEWRAMTLLARAGAGATPVIYDPQPPGPAEAYVVSCPRGALFAPGSAHLDQEHLGRWLVRAWRPAAEVGWVYPDFPVIPRATRNEIVIELERVRALRGAAHRQRARQAEALLESKPRGLGRGPLHLCLSDWSQVLLVDTGEQLLALGLGAPVLGDVARDLAALARAAALPVADVARLIAACASCSERGAAALAERVAFFLNAWELVGAPTSGAEADAMGDATRATVGAKIYAGALPDPALLRRARGALITSAPARATLRAQRLSATPTASARCDSRQRLILHSSSATGRRNLEHAWALARARGELALPCAAPELRWRLEGPHHEQVSPSLRRALRTSVRQIAPRRRCLVTWPEGALMFLRMQRLIAEGHARGVIAQLYAGLAVARFQLGFDRLFAAERVRLRAAGVSAAQLARLDHALPTDLVRTAELRAAQLDHPFPHTLLSYPWGRDAACALGRALAATGVRELFFIGGCGALNAAADVEDIVIPSRVACRDARSIALGQDKLAEDVSAATRRLGAAARTWRGPLFDVDTALEEDDALLRRLRRRGFTAVEMEVYGLALAAREAGIAFGCALDVTDVPLAGKGYLFDLEARRAVSRRPTRARHACLEAYYRAGG